MQKIIYTESQLPAVVADIIANASSKVLCFYGEMGAGKTTLIKALVTALGANAPGNSPTFGIVNEYHTAHNTLLAYHFDFYRINDELEALDLGLEDYLSSDAWIFIEWPEKIQTLLPKETMDIQITVVDQDTRAISL